MAQRSNAGAQDVQGSDIPTADALFGDSAADLSGAQGTSDTLLGAEADLHPHDPAESDAPFDVFVKQQGSGTDYVHDFEAQADVVDLTAYNLTYQDVQDAMNDVGWATQIELTGFSGIVDDRIYLKNVEPDQLDESNFAL